MSIKGITVGTPMLRPDWNQDNPLKSDYIKNKPDVCRKNPKYTATPKTLVDVISKAEAGATIQLTDGDYPLLELKGKKSYPENLTIIGGEGVTIAGISITSGIKDDTLKNYADTANAIMPKGLTLKNLMFPSGSLSLRNCSLDDLCIESCYFDYGARINIKPNAMSDEYGNDHTNPNSPIYTTRMNQLALDMKNLVIKNCTLMNAYKGAQDSAIYIQGVDGIIIEKNWIKYVAYNGINICGVPDYSVLNRGVISVTGNTISDTNSRSIRLSSIADADVYVLDNTLRNANVTDTGNVDVAKISGCTDTKIVCNANYHNGEAVTVNNGITIAEWTVPHDERTDNPHKVTAAQIGAVTQEELQEALDSIESGGSTELTAHKNNKSNPHGVTATQVGLGNVPNVSTNNQTPTYTEAAELKTLSSGEKMSTAFGKIKKAISTLISHIENKSNPHGVTASQLNLVKYVTQKGESNGVKYCKYNDGTAECWGVVSVTVPAALMECDIQDQLPIGFSSVDCISALVNTGELTGTTAIERAFYVQYAEHVPAEDRYSESLCVHFRTVGNSPSSPTELKVYVHVWGTAE